MTLPHTTKCVSRFGLQCDCFIVEASDAARSEEAWHEMIAARDETIKRLTELLIDVRGAIQVVCPQHPIMKAALDELASIQPVT